MIEVLLIVANSWPIAVMVVGLGVCVVVRRCIKQAMDNSAEVQTVRASNAVVVRQSDSAG